MRTEYNISKFFRGGFSDLRKSSLLPPLIEVVEATPPISSRLYVVQVIIKIFRFGRLRKKIKSKNGFVDPLKGPDQALKPTNVEHLVPLICISLSLYPISGSLWTAQQSDGIPPCSSPAPPPPPPHTPSPVPGGKLYCQKIHDKMLRDELRVRVFGRLLRREQRANRDVGSGAPTVRLSAAEQAVSDPDKLGAGPAEQSAAALCGASFAGEWARHYIS